MKTFPNVIEICLTVHTKLLDREDTYLSYLNGADWVHKMSQEAMNKISYILLMKPIRSPDLNPHQEHISSCWHISKERCHHEEDQKRDL